MVNLKLIKNIIHKGIIVRFTDLMLDPVKVHKLCKEIDGDPRPGTHILAWNRVTNFHWVHDRQVFYEPLLTYNDLFRAVYQNSRLVNSYASNRYLDGIQVSFHIFESARTAPMGKLSLSTTWGRYKGAHAVMLCGWDDAGESLVFQNTWGTGWGNKGFGSVSRDYLDRYLTDAWLRRRARYGPAMHKVTRFNSATTDKEFYKAWELDNPRWNGGHFLHAGDNYKYYIYGSWSLQDNCPVEIIEIRNGIGIRVGWAHLFHPYERPRRSVIKELFVWPAFRRKGFGTKLEAATSYRARMWRSLSIEIWFHGIDAWPRVRAAGRKFGERVGYTWKGGNSTRPFREAIGYKTL